jgi:hypothetical protein
VYCNNPGTVEADRRRVKELFTGREGVVEVLEPSQYHEHGLPHPREYAQSPDLVLVCADGYAVNADAAGEAWIEPSEKVRTSLGSHGFLARSPQMNALCVVAGRGIRPARRCARRRISTSPRRRPDCWALKAFRPTVVRCKGCCRSSARLLRRRVEQLECFA